MTRSTRSRRIPLVKIGLVLLWVASARPVLAQSKDTAIARPIPAKVAFPPEYQRAIDRGWRTATGSPGPDYWQQGVKYDLEARLDPATAKLEGTVRIAYANNAPIALRSVWLYLYQNFQKAGVIRHDSAGELTDGVTLRRVVAEGEELAEGDLKSGPAYHVNGTLMELRPPAQVEQGDTLHLEIQWEVTLPQKGLVGRMGYSDHDVYLVAYWFPKMAVLDDLHVWDAEPFLGTGEFYDDFGDYTAALTVPANWTVMATGTLQNPDSVFSALTLDRLAAAEVSDTLVTIAGQPERDAHTVTAEPPDSLLTYRFAAKNVRDFVWTASDVQEWDATSAVVPDRDGDGKDDRVRIDAFWRPDRASAWSQEWLYGKESIEHHSKLTGLTYPWSHMTLVEGADIIDGGMEYPMLSLIDAYSGRGDGQALFSTTSHETAHMWIPMIVGSNEKRYAWIDEGSADFIDDESLMDFWPGVDHRRIEAQPYLVTAKADGEESMMRQADWYSSGNAYGIASYNKPATLMVALRDVLGEDVWDQAYRTFISEWAYKHPTPWDFFDTFERFAGEDLDWFWTSFYYETWKLDLAVREVRKRPGGGSVVVIDDLGQAPYPAKVRIRTADGRTLDHVIPVEHWLAGNTTYEIELGPETGTVTRVEIDPDGHSPDIDRTNNLWPRG
jgi:Peptidase family M1 domain